MPRRIPDYPDAYAFFNIIASFGAWLSFLSLLYFIYIIYRAFVESKNNTTFAGKYIKLNYRVI
jgi:heme/copper-type cytochrome/quinol oxidase subunit 1